MFHVKHGAAATPTRPLATDDRRAHPIPCPITARLDVGLAIAPQEHAWDTSTRTRPGRPWRSQLQIPLRPLAGTPRIDVA